MDTSLQSKYETILITGATGYIGGRLAPVLLDAGYQVRVLVRDASRLHGRPWLDQVDVVQGDVLEPESLASALEGVDIAYYLIHSMRGGENFQERDIRGARNFGTVAKQKGVKRIIYLGGLGDSAADLSKHLRSRQETGDALRECGVPVTEFRAGVIIGSGSISFEMIRYLTERLPIMICPSWIYTRIQPISIRDMLSYLLATLTTPESSGRTIEIGGAEVLTYRDMMIGYAKARGLRRLMIPVPVLTPRLSSYWVHLVTPIPSDIARPLIDGLHNEVVVRDDTAKQLFPQIQPTDFMTAVRRALAKLNARDVETSWADALVSSRPLFAPAVLTTHEGMIIEQRQRMVKASPRAVYRSFTSVGGENGWLYLNWAWQLRGIVDRLFGGVGMRRGRRSAADMRIGEALDFWRVEAIEPDHLLRLRAEMRLPGVAWLQFKAEPLDSGYTHLTQEAFFAPKGLLGFLYWYGLYPIHRLIFSGMIRKFAERAEMEA